MSAEGQFNPSSESKLEGSYGGMVPLTTGSDLTAGRMLYQSPQMGERLPMAPVSGNDEGRPEEPLIHGRRTPVRIAPRSDDELLALARQSFNASDTYFNANHRNRILDAMARFNSEHPRGSKYHSPAFDKRSKLFRPKTRATIRKREAAAAISLFGSNDIVSVTATAKGDPAAMQDARVQEALLNYRLKENKRWYLFVVGAVQDAERQGFAIARTYWDYEEADRYYDELHPELGPVKRVDTVATRDRPGFCLVPVERFHFSPAADWMDVVNTSPYLIEEIPMYVCDVRRYAENPNARLKYRDLSVGQLLSGGRASEWDSIQLQRERNTQSRYQRSEENSDYAVVWVHRNIMKIDGEDYVFDTIGTTMMLSNVVPLSEFDPRGYRGYVIGSTLVESHNPMNPGGATLMGQVQDEINDTANLRQDANKMASAGRMFVKRNTGLDLHALARFSPGATVELDNPDTDVKWDRSPEAPRGAFEENQLLNLELDDVMGNFSQSSVGGNRNLNETVGGMQMLGDSANQLTEYDLHTIVKTFFTDVLRQIMDLERQWETDTTLAAIIGSRLAVSTRQYWKSLKTPTVVEVDVGFGATNPAKRVERVALGLQTVGQYFPQMIQQADQFEIAKIVFSAIGINDVSAIFPMMDSKGQPQDPKLRVLQQQVQQLQQMTQPGQIQLQIAQLRLKQMMQIAEANNASSQKIKMMELKLAYIELQLESEKNEIARAELMLKREELSNQITMQRMEFMLQEATATASMSPPNVMLPEDAATEAASLEQPGSNMQSLPSFGQRAQTAGSYVDSTQGGGQ